MAQLYTLKKIDTSQEFIVYSNTKSNIVSERKGNHLILYTHKDINDSILKKTITDYKVASYVKKITKDELKYSMYFAGKKILIIDSTFTLPQGIKPDIVLLMNSPKINLDRLLEQTQTNTIVANGTNAYSLIQRWKQSCHDKNIEFHATAEEGYFRLAIIQNLSK